MRQWIYSRNKDEYGLLHAKDKNDNSVTYRGEWNDELGQPNGLGAIHQHNTYLEGGIWDCGDLIQPMPEEDYEREINSLYNRSRRHNW